MKIYKAIPLIAVILTASSGLTSCGNYKDKITVTMCSTSDDFNHEFFYTDDYFRKPSTQFNISLATMSLGVAIAAFPAKISRGNYINQSANLKAFWEKAGFTDPYVNNYYEKKPTSYSIGYGVAKKQIDDYTLLSVGIRGGNYEAEWASNFEIGLENEKSKNHVGFQSAADKVFAGIKSYIERHNVTGKIKIWLNGFSRGGATANLTAGLIDSYIALNKSPFANCTIGKDDLFAYCFEAPQGAYYDSELNGTDNPKSSIYSNIFSILNYNDPVPKVVMNMVDSSFTRYGVDYFLPDRVLTPDYISSAEVMNYHYLRMPEGNHIGDYKIDDFVYYPFYNGNEYFSLGIETVYNHPSIGHYLKDWISALGIYGAKNRGFYYQTIQSGLFNFLEAFSSKAISPSMNRQNILTLLRNIFSSDLSNILFQDLIYNPQYFAKDLEPIIKTVFSDDKFTPLYQGLDGIFNAIYAVNEFDKTLIPPFLSISNVLAFASCHYPELCLAWLMSLDPNYGTPARASLNDGKYMCANFKNAEKVTILNSKGEELLFFNLNDNNGINSDVFDVTQNKYYPRSLCADFSIINGLKVYLPYGEKYTFVVEKVDPNYSIIKTIYNPLENREVEYETTYDTAGEINLMSQ